MPDVFALLPEDKAKGVTRYRAFVGSGLAFDPDSLLTIYWRSFPDGLSFTIMVAEGEPVPWTKPEEFVFSEKRAPWDVIMKAPLPKLGGVLKDRFAVLRVDGYVEFLPRTFDEKTFRAALGRMDGVRFDWSDFWKK
jgi:hypothetical protein